MPVAQHRPGDRSGVDLVGLPRLALAAAGGAHQLRRRPAGLARRRRSGPARGGGRGCRQSSIAHTSSSPSSCAQRNASRCPCSLAVISRSPSSCPSRRRRPRARGCSCGHPLRSRSSARPFNRWSRLIGPSADRPFSGRLPRSYQVTPQVLGGGGRHNGRTVRPGWPTSRLRVSPSPAQDPTRPAGRQRQQQPPCQLSAPASRPLRPATSTRSPEQAPGPARSQKEQTRCTAVRALCAALCQFVGRSWALAVFMRCADRIEHPRRQGRGLCPLPGVEDGRARTRRLLPVSRRRADPGSRSLAGRARDARCVSGSTALRSTARISSRLMEGRHPAPGAWIRSAGADGNRGGGIDLTFSAPKSVSTVWALGSEDQRRGIEEAHAAAVEQAMAHLDRDRADGAPGSRRADRGDGSRSRRRGVPPHHRSRRRGWRRRRTRRSTATSS